MGKKYLLIILGSLFAFTLYGSYQNDNIFQLFFYLGLGIPWIIIYFKTILEFIEVYKSNNRLIKYSTLLIGTLILLLNIGIFSFYEMKLNSPTLIKAYIFGGYTDFKRNGEYVIVSGSWASRKHFYGKYIIRDSVIFVDRSRFDDILTTDRFVIREADSLIKDTYKDKEIIIKKCLIQIDKKGKEIIRGDYQKNFRPRIVEYNLKH
jgi:hypothetical protein